VRVEEVFLGGAGCFLVEERALVVLSASRLHLKKGRFFLTVNTIVLKNLAASLTRLLHIF